MSPAAALVLVLLALGVLGGVAAWLINVPVWAIGVLIVLGGLLVRRFFRRVSAGRARQDTEASR